MSMLPTPETQSLDLFDVAIGVEDFETPFDQYLGAKLREGFWGSLPGQFAAEAQSSNQPADMQQRAEWRRAAARGEAIRYNEPVIPEADWKTSEWHREGVEWDQRMTETRARALADIFDENAYRRWQIEKSPTGVRSVAGFVSQVVGGAPDPVNYIPVFGPATRAAALARFAKVMGPNAAKVAAPAAVQGAEAMIGAAAVSPVLISSMRSYGDDVGFADAVLDVAFAGVFGAGFGGTAGAWRAFRDRGAVLDTGVQADAAGTLDKAVADMASGRPVDVEKSALLRARERIRAEVEALRADPDLEPGPASEVLARLTPETMQDVVVEVRRGAAMRKDGVLVTPKRGGEGLVKLEIKHPEVTDAQVLALPDVLLEQAGELRSAAGPTEVWEWRRHMDGAEVVYRLKAVDKEKNAGKMFLVTIFRRTDPEKFLGETAYRDGRSAATGPMGSTGRFQSSDTRRAFSISVTREPGQPTSDIIADRAFTVTGREVPVQYEVVEAADLVASHDLDLVPNEAFPKELQPRARERVASVEQVSRIAANLNPELLGRSAAAGDGAPIIGPDGVVESGNGRVLAIRKAYGAGGEAAARYRAWLERQGFPVEGMREPVLVRRRTGELDPAERAAFTREANERPILALSATERALADAQVLDADMVSLYQGGAFTSDANKGFVRAFLERVAPEDRAALVDADGRLSADGVRRIEAALLAKAYDDPNLVAVLAEDPDPDIKTIGAVLKATAPDWIRLRAAVAEGVVAPDMDQTRALLRAVDLIRNARDKGEKIRDVAAQMDMFDPMTAEVGAFLRIFHGEELGRAVGRDKVMVALGRYAADAMMNLRHGLFPARPVGDVLAAARGLKTKDLDFTAPAERVEADPPPAPKAGDELDAMARDLGLDPRTGDFDELIDLKQLEAEGRLRPEETDAVRQAEDLMRAADAYEPAFEAAAICMTRVA